MRRESAVLGLLLCLLAVIASGTYQSHRRGAAASRRAAGARLLASSRDPLLGVEGARPGLSPTPPALAALPAALPEEAPLWKVPVGRSPVRGRSDALVTIIEFADFQCPWSGKAQAPLQEIARRYGDDVRIVWKHGPLPFHARAAPANELALEALRQKGAAGFWAAHDLLFRKECGGVPEARDRDRCQEGGGIWVDHQAMLSDEDLLRHARALGLNERETETAIRSERHAALISADVDLAADFQAEGRPYFFVNGRRLIGAQPIERFVALIDAERARAVRLIERGVPRERIYEALIEHGQERPLLPRRRVPAPPAESPRKGRVGAEVVLQVWGDLQSPFSQRAHKALLEVERSHGDRIGIVWRDRPLLMSASSVLAAEAGREVWKQRGPEAFWRLHDRLFDELGPPYGPLERPAITTLAVSLGADAAAFGKALDGHAHAVFLDAEAAAAEKAGISVAPAFVVGRVEAGWVDGYYISGVPRDRQLARIVELALAETGSGSGARRAVR